MDHKGAATFNGTPGIPLNCALWTTGALVLRTIDDRLAEQCLRTALIHMPEDQQATGHLASQWAVAGRVEEALALANALPKTILKSSINEAIQSCREVSDDIAVERLIQFKALYRMGGGRTNR